METHYNLSQLLQIVDHGFNEIFRDKNFWFICEVSRVNRVKKFVYFDLVEYDNANNIIAKAKGILRNGYKFFHFLQKTKLKESELEGVRILFCGKCHFHHQYGFSLQINDISAEYTIGHIQQKQENILEKLTKLGIAKQNKEKELGFPIYTIAIISSETAQGYIDFKTILGQSGFVFSTKLYESVVHGNNAKVEVKQQLQNINKDILDGEKIDVIAIIRGGGESSGIARQNDFDIAQKVCNMQVPVMIAIGHTTDKYILDDITRYSCKTPTDAGYILTKETEKRLQNAKNLYENINKTTENKLINSVQNIKRLYDDINMLATNKTNKIKSIVENLYNDINKLSEQKQLFIHRNINSRYKGIIAFKPNHMHKKGYATIHKSNQTFLSHKEIENLKQNKEVIIKIYDKEIKMKVL